MTRILCNLLVHIHIVRWCTVHTLPSLCFLPGPFWTMWTSPFQYWFEDSVCVRQCLWTMRVFFFLRIVKVWGVSSLPGLRLYEELHSSYNRITTGHIEKHAKYHVPNLQHTACKRSWGRTIEVRNMLSHQVLWINSIIKHCVSCWITYILQDDTRSIQYHVKFSFLKVCKIQRQEHVPDKCIFMIFLCP